MKGVRDVTAWIEQHYQQAPSTWEFMRRVFHPRPGWAKAGGVPPIRLSWNNLAWAEPDLAAIAELTGLPAAPLSILIPHILTFRLNMAMVTHPAFPEPLWGALQIRNRLLQHLPLSLDQQYSASTAVVAQRVLDKGAEVDLHTRLMRDGQVAWESLNTFYYRGRFGLAGTPSAVAAPPSAQGELMHRWHAPSGSGWRFGGLTGDFNGIHWSRRYARVFGFRRDFHHPQRVLGQCLARLVPPSTDGRQRLDIWLKGPVYYDADLQLKVQALNNGMCFSLSQDQDERAAIVATWRAGAEGEQLLDLPASA